MAGDGLSPRRLEEAWVADEAGRSSSGVWTAPLMVTSDALLILREWPGGPGWDRECVEEVSWRTIRSSPSFSMPLPLERCVLPAWLPRLAVPDRGEPGCSRVCVGWTPFVSRWRVCSLRLEVVSISVVGLALDPFVFFFSFSLGPPLECASAVVLVGFCMLTLTMSFSSMPSSPSWYALSISGTSPSQSSTDRIENAEPRMLAKSLSAVIINANGSSS